MNLFASVKEAVTTRQAAEHYGLKVNRNGMACCPFHNDRNPSLKVDERFYCFGCHEKGDVIDFVAKLFGLRPYDAARKLAADFGIDPNTTPPAAAAKVSPYQQRQDEGRRAAVLIDYECLLKRWKVDYAPQTVDEPWDDRFAEACKELPTITYLVDCMYSTDAQARKELMNLLIESGEIDRLKDRLAKEEVRHDAPDIGLAA